MELFLDFAKEAGELRDDVVEVLEDVFETGSFQLPSGENVTLLLNGTLPPRVEQAATAAKYIYDDINLQEEAARGMIRSRPSTSPTYFYLFLLC